MTITQVIDSPQSAPFITTPLPVIHDTRDFDVPLYGGTVAVINEVDAPLVAGLKWRINSNGYAVAYAGGGRSSPKTVLMHRLIARTPAGMFTDHIDGDKLNNRRANLRVCTQAENIRNTPRRDGGHSQYKGVTWFQSRRHKTGYWKAYIAGKHIGYFDTEEAAARAYDTRASELFGEFARLNFPGTVSPLDRITA